MSSRMIIEEKDDEIFSKAPIIKTNSFERKVQWWNVPSKKDTEIILKFDLPKRIIKLDKIVEKHKNLKHNIFFLECKIDIETVQTIWQELKHELIYAEKVCSYLGTFTSGLMATLQNKLSRSTEVQCILMRDSSVYRENLKEYIDESESMYQEIGDVKKEIMKYPNIEDYQASLDIELRTKTYMMLDKFTYCRNRLLYTRKLFLKNWDLLIRESPDEEQIGLFN